MSLSVEVQDNRLERILKRAGRFCGPFVHLKASSNGSLFLVIDMFLKTGSLQVGGEEEETGRHDKQQRRIIDGKFNCKTETGRAAGNFCQDGRK